MSERDRITLTVATADITTGASYWIGVPSGGTIYKFSTCTFITTVVDNIITLEIGGTAVTGGALTMTASGSAAGDVTSVYPTALNVIPVGGSVEIVNPGSATTGTFVTFILEIDRDQY